MTNLFGKDNAETPVVVSKEMAVKYGRILYNIMPIFNKIVEDNGGGIRGAYLAISIALRVAAKLSVHYGVNKSGFVTSATNNYTLENANSEQKTINNNLN